MEHTAASKVRPMIAADGTFRRIEPSGDAVTAHILVSLMERWPTGAHQETWVTESPHLWEQMLET